MNSFISSFEEACAKLGKTTELPDVSKWPERLQKHLLALHKLDTILEVNNDGWEPKLADTNQRKYYPWFRINEDSEGPAGFRLSFGDCGYGGDGSGLGARLACRSRELATFMGENCPDLYAELHQ